MVHCSFARYAPVSRCPRAITGVDGWPIAIRHGLLAATLLAAGAFGFAPPAAARPCDGDDTACARARARVGAAIRAQPDLAEIARYAEERRRSIMAHQTNAAATAMMRDERLFDAGLAGLLTGDQFEERNRQLALDRLKGRWRSLDRMSAVAEHIAGYWENAGGAVDVARSATGRTRVTFLSRQGDSSLIEQCNVASAVEPGGTTLRLSIPQDIPLTFSLNDGALWVAPYRGRNACALAIASSVTYFSARPEIHVPSP